MGLIDSIIAAAFAAARAFGVAVIEDPHQVLTVSETGPEVTLIPYAGDLAFRRRWEPIRQSPSPQPVLIHATVREPFYPDVLDRCPHAEQRVRVTPQGLLSTETKDPSWPSSVNEFGRCLAQYFEGIVRAHESFRRSRPSGMSDDEARRLVLSGIVGFDVSGALDPLAVWRLFFERPEIVAGLERVHASFPEVLQEAVAGLGGPFALVAAGDAETAARAVWTAAILAQHVDAPLELLPSLDTALFEAQNWDLGMAKALSQSVRQGAPALAERQVRDAEGARSPEAWRRIVGKLRLGQPREALHAATREELSPAIFEAAVAHLCSELPNHPPIAASPELASLLQECETGSPRLSALAKDGSSARVGLELLGHIRALLAVCQSAPNRVSQAIAQAKATASVEPLLEAYARTELHAVELLASLAKRRAEDMGDGPGLPEDLAAQLTRRTRERVGKLGDLAREPLGDLNNAFCALVAEKYPVWLTTSDRPALVADVIPRILLPYWQQHDKPATWILLFDGMRWDVWERYVLPALREKLDFVDEDAAQAQPVLAILPSSTRHSRRALFAGRLPDGFAPNEAENKLLAEAWREGPKELQVDKPEDRDAQAQVSLEMTAGGVRVVVFGFCDKILHQFGDSLAALYEDNIQKKAVRELAKVLKTLPEDALVLVVTDHGFVEAQDSWTVVPKEAAADPRDITFRYAVLEQEFTPDHRAVAFPASALRLPDHITIWERDTSRETTKQQTCVVLAKGHSYLRRGNAGGKPPRYGHGGISLQELVVPCAVMAPRRPTEVPTVKLLSCRLVREDVVEGEAVEVRAELSLSGCLLLDVVAEIDGDLRETKRLTLSSDPKTPVAFHFTAPAVPEDEESREVMLSLQITCSGGGKPKLPRKKALQLNVRADPRRVARKRDDTLDTMFGKKR